MADEIMTTDEEATNQKLALVEQSLDALYQTMDKIQGEKNHVSRNKLWHACADTCTLLIFMDS